jgi:hypothetical protein
MYRRTTYLQNPPGGSFLDTRMTGPKSRDIGSQLKVDSSFFGSSPDTWGRCYVGYIGCATCSSAYVLPSSEGRSLEIVTQVICELTELKVVLAVSLKCLPLNAKLLHLSALPWRTL